MQRTKKLIMLFTIFLFSVLLASGCSTEKAPAPKENLPAPQAPENAARNSYDIQLTLDTAGKMIDSRVKVKLTNSSQDTWSQLCFRDYISAIGQTFDEMNGLNSKLESEFTEIYNISSNESLNYARAADDKSVLFVSLNPPSNPGESIEIRFDYKAPVPENAFR